MEKPKFITSTSGNCGVYAIMMALNALGLRFDTHELENHIKLKNISYFGEIYTQKQLVNTLESIKNYGISFNYLCENFNEEDLAIKIREQLELGRYILIPYYAFQGFVKYPKKVTMSQGHWMVIYNIDKEDKIYGIQSNGTANTLGALNKIDIDCIYKSNNRLKEVKINWGKYYRCIIRIPKKQLEYRARCGYEQCLIKENLAASKCIYFSNINNIFISIYK